MSRAWVKAAASATMAFVVAHTFGPALVETFGLRDAAVAVLRDAHHLPWDAWWETAQSAGRVALAAAGALCALVLMIGIGARMLSAIDDRRQERRLAAEYEAYHGEPQPRSSGLPSRFVWSDGRLHAFPEPDRAAGPR